MVISDVIGRRAPGRLVVRAAMPVLCAGICLALLAAQLDGLDPASVASGLASISAGEWIAALCLTLVSFAAVSQYDVLFHGWLSTGIGATQARLSGAAAIAISQTLGFGILTGTLARWRANGSLSFLTALKLTNYVSFSFMAVLGGFSLTAIWASGSIGIGLYLAGIGSACVIAIVLSLTQPFPLPSLALMGRLVILAAIDILGAALALWVLLPGQAGIDPVALVAAFTLALGLALLSGAPGGVGPFELYLVAALPAVPQPDLLAAILGFRLVYYALPACLALLCLARPFRTAPPVATSHNAPIKRAEAGLARLSTHSLLHLSQDAMVIARASQSCVAIGDPVSGKPMTPTMFDALKAAADQSTLLPVLYKGSAKSAAAARRMGWAVLALSEEAWVDPRAFTITGAARRQLRRKLRQSTTAGVTLTMPTTLPIPQMQRVARDWSARCGGERGFSMGHFDPNYIRHQTCVTAWHNDRLVAFATFHTTSSEWTLDLMRSTTCAPDGTMHSLVAHAIQQAANAGVPRLSLAAMPLAAPKEPLRWLAQRRDARGLRQFKASFAPMTSPLYLAAPTRLHLALAGLDILLRIRHPARSDTTP